GEFSLDALATLTLTVDGGGKVLADGARFRLIEAAMLPGDFNSDGMVDAADYTVWRDNLGESLFFPNGQPAAVLQPAPEPAAAVLLCLTVFAVSSKVAVEQVRRHPADNLIEGLNSEPRRAYLMMELLDAPEALSDLGCDPSQAAEVRQLVEGWSLFSAGAMQAWQTEHPDFRGFGQFERRVLQPYLIETQQGVDRLLRPEQQLKLQQQVYHELGWRALFLFEVSHELGLSGKQRRELKDILLREVRERETPAPCPTSSILNDRQRRQLASMQGRDR
ncbi:MAG: hypothetical protein AAGF97_15030, partial [Planctomycetota bacterium]